MAKGYHPLRRRSSDPIPGKNSFETNNNSNSVPSNTSVNMNCLPNLPLNSMAIPYSPVNNPSPRDNVEISGRVLFQHFIQEELVHQGIPDEILEIENPPPDTFGDIGPEMLHGYGDVNAQAVPPGFIGTPSGYKTSYFTALGANIRNIADEFANSHERKKIRQQADDVDLGHITYNTFHDLLTELFREGINKYRIVSLFFFCSDVLVRCIKNELHKLGSKLFFWALQFLLNNVCKWVQDHGGWEKVFYNVYTVMKHGVLIFAGLTAIGCGLTAIGCGYVYIKKNM